MPVDAAQPSALRADARPYLAFAATAFKRQLAYRLANWAGLFTNTLFLFFRAYALAACVVGRGSVAGMSTLEVTSYVTLTQALLMVVPQWGRTGMSADVRSGQIAVDLGRPVSFPGVFMARRLGISAYYVLARGAPLLAVGAVAGLLATPAGSLPALALAVIVGAWIANAVLFCVEVTSFWLESDNGPRYLVTGTALLFSGLILPIAFFPEEIRQLSAWLPFQYTLDLPVRIYLGRLTGADLARALAAQLAWAFALWVAVHLAFAAGTRRLTVHGG